MSIRFEYDSQADAVYLKLSDSQIIESEEIADGIIYDYADNDEIVGIEILGIKSKSPAQLKQINFPFSVEEKAILKEFFVTVLV